MPKLCPVCQSKTVREKGETDYRCTGGFFCSSQRKQRLLHFTSKNAMAIDGIGQAIADELVDCGLVQDPSDLYHLDAQMLVNRLQSVGEKTANKLIEAISMSKDTSLAKFIYALGIRHVGETTAKNLSAHFKLIDDLAGANLTELQAIPDIGPIVAKSVFDYFQDGRNIEMLSKMRFNLQNTIRSKSDVLKGKTFVITGSFSQMTRDEIKSLIESNGGTVSSSVSSKTTYVLAGQDPGTKLSKAKELGVPVIDLTELLAMV
jgi:DNA ligase (NAD+)